MHKPLLLLGLLTALSLAAACNSSGGSEGGGPSPSGGAAQACAAETVNEPIDSEILPIVISSDHAVGENRFVLGLIDQTTEQPLTGAKLHLEFLCFDTDKGSTAFELDPDAVVLTKSYTHTHDDGTIEEHSAGETGAYVNTAIFDRPGNWGVIVTGTTADGREVGPARPTFNVNEEAFGLIPGDPAPRSEQPLVSDVKDIKEIDTSETPNPDQHNMTVAEAIESGKPTVVAFATPAFCQSQICGPMKEIFDGMHADYSGRANFIHIEPYDVPRMRSGDCKTLAECLVPTIEEWKLQSEPFVFVIAGDGVITARFDGIASEEELRAALEVALGGG
jgi:hypothetical protein